MLIPLPNRVTDVGSFYISYNDRDVSIYGADTTALVIGQMEKFYILNGDHQRAYRDLMCGGLDACLDYFRVNVALMNGRSDTPPPAGTPHHAPQSRC